NILNHHNYCYYIKSAPEITDYEYDQLYRELLDLEEKYPQFLSLDSPTQRVGTQPVSGFDPYSHKVALKSLANAFNFEELRDFDARLKKNLDLASTELIEYICELKN
ncbi:MAG: hypothetical protein OMM_12685, partial [Candidatus Magnetoglobus multicellularis str. Araruama]